MPDSAALRLGVVTGDLVTAINGDKVQGHQEFLELLQAIGKPVLITFARSAKATANRSVPAASLNEEEKKARREATLAAAQDRGKSWDKKVQSGRTKRKDNEDTSGRTIYDHSQLAEMGASNPETQRMVMLSKQMEQNHAQALGYNPFQPHMSSSSNTNGVGPLKGFEEGRSPTSPSTYAPASSAYGGAYTGSSSSGKNDTNSNYNSTKSDNDSGNDEERERRDLEEGEAFQEVVDGVDCAMGLLLGVAPEDGPKVTQTPTPPCTIHIANFLSNPILHSDSDSIFNLCSSV
jgi:membrane-associated protease RseP (regulator of RpoE activity)